MPRRWKQLAERPLSLRHEFPDPVPHEAAKLVHDARKPSMMEGLAVYRQLMAEGRLAEVEPEVADQLDDFYMPDEEDQVLSEYQIEMLALAIEADQAEETPPADPPAEPEPPAEPPAEPAQSPT